MKKWTFKKVATYGATEQPQKANTTANPFPNFKATLLVQTPSTHTYGIENYDGMTEQEILNACDPCNFGGQVYGNIVKVYID